MAQYTPMVIIIICTISCTVFPLKLGNRGKYLVIIKEYRVIVSEYYIKDYVIPHQNSSNTIVLPT